MIFPKFTETDIIIINVKIFIFKLFILILFLLKINIINVESKNINIVTPAWLKKLHHENSSIIFIPLQNPHIKFMRILMTTRTHEPYCCTAIESNLTR